MLTNNLCRYANRGCADSSNVLRNRIATRSSLASHATMLKYCLWDSLKEANLLISLLQHIW